MEDRKALEEAVEVARATVEATPAEPPTWQYARAISTYANTLLVEDDFTTAREWAARGLAAARAADAPWVQADALVTLGFISNREGRNDEAIKLLTEAHKQAREAKDLGVELRAAYHLARAHLERGDLAIGAAVALRGHQAGQPDRARHRAVRQGRPAPALPVPLRGRQVGSRAGDRGRLPGPGDQRSRGPAVLHGAVHRHRTGQPGRRRSGVPGSSRSCRPRGSTGSSRAGCSPSTPCGRATSSWP